MSSRAFVPTRNLRLVIEYDGTDFKGWQVQPSERTVQRTLEAAFLQLVGHPVKVQGSGRTDAGVHATGQVANVLTSTHYSVERVRHSLHGLLPKDVSVISVEDVPLSFHALKSAKGKFYRYSVLNRRSRSAYHARTSWHVPSSLDIPRMKDALEALLGTHDFIAFQGAGASTKTSIRTLTKAALEVKESGFLFFSFEATGFLKYMVRSLVGTVIAIGEGKMEFARLEKLLAPGPRSLVGPTAPPQGLVLVKVYYGSV